MLNKKTLGLLLALSCTSGWAETADYTYYVGGNAGLLMMDEKQAQIQGDGLEEGAAFGAELGFRSAIWDALEFRVRFNQGEINLEGHENSSSATWLAMDALLFFPNDYNYAFIGSHYQKLGDYSQPGYHLGAGARHPLSERWALTGEIQTLYGMDLETWDLMAIVGVQYFFGRKTSAAARRADSDGDGVNNRLDRCPNTPAGYSVDQRGCTLYQDAVVRREVTILFEHNRAEVPESDYANVEEIAEFMRKHPQLDVVVQGHTSLVGDEAYNQKLSEQRAEAVKTLLVNRYEIPDRRIITQGLGEREPVIQQELSADDAAKNRRIWVEMQVREKLF